MPPALDTMTFVDYRIESNEMSSVIQMRADHSLKTVPGICAAKERRGVPLDFHRSSLFQARSHVRWSHLRSLFGLLKEVIIY